MNNWTRWVGDWKKKTVALSLVEKGAYGELLDHAYVTEELLPLDAVALYRIAGAFTDEERRAVDNVIAQFFSRTEAGYSHHRVNEEIKKRADYSERQRGLANRRWEHEREEAQRKLAKKANGSGSPHEPPDDSPIVERIPLVSGEEWEVRQSFVDELDRLYPAVDPAQTLREIRGWCLGNPSKLKTKTGVRRFVTAWFAREQDRGSA